MKSNGKKVVKTKDIKIKARRRGTHSKYTEINYFFDHYGLCES